MKATLVGLLFFCFAMTLGCRDSSPSNPPKNILETSQPGSSLPGPSPSKSAMPSPGLSPGISPKPSPQLSPFLGVRKLEIVKGQGVANSGYWPFGEPFTVRLTDAQGTPLIGKTIRFQATDGVEAISFVNVETTTDTQGVASAQGRAGFVSTSVSGVRATIMATDLESNQSVTFYATTLTYNTNGFVFPSSTIKSPEPYATIPIRVGETLPAAITVQYGYLVGADTGRGIPDVGLQVWAHTPLSSPSEPLPSVQAGCVGGTVLSNSVGLATCDLSVTAGAPGTYQLNLHMYGANDNQTLKIEILP